MLPEAVLHAHAHGRPTLRNLAQAWNKMLQKELEPMSHVKTDTATAFLALLEEPKLTALADVGKKPPIEILPPGMPSLTAPPIVIKKPNAGATPAPTLTAPEKPLMLEAAVPAADQSSSAADKATTSLNTDATSYQNPDQGNGTMPRWRMVQKPRWRMVQKWRWQTSQMLRCQVEIDIDVSKAEVTDDIYL